MLLVGLVFHPCLKPIFDQVSPLVQRPGYPITSEDSSAHESCEPVNAVTILY